MTRPKRFRGMELTEDEASALAWWSPAKFDTRKQFDAYVARAKRLLPLWRTWGLRDLADKSFAKGWDANNDAWNEVQS